MFEFGVKLIVIVIIAVCVYRIVEVCVRVYVGVKTIFGDFIVEVNVAILFYRRIQE